MYAPCGRVRDIPWTGGRSGAPRRFLSRPSARRLRGIRTPTGCPRQVPSHSMLIVDRTPIGAKCLAAHGRHCAGPRPSTQSSLAYEGDAGKPQGVALRVGPQGEVTDGDGHDVDQLAVRRPLLERPDVGLAGVVDHPIEEARHVEHLHLHEEGGPAFLPAPHVQDRELHPQQRRKLLPGKVLDLDDGAVSAALQQVVEQPRQHPRVLTKHLAEHHIVLQIGVAHAPTLAPPRTPRPPTGPPHTAGRRLGHPHARHDRHPSGRSGPLSGGSGHRDARQRALGRGRSTTTRPRRRKASTRRSAVSARRGNRSVRRGAVVVRPGKVVTRPGKVVSRRGKVVARRGKVVARRELV